MAPLDGSVETRHVSVGDYVKPGDSLLTITDMRSLRALLPFPETVAHLLQTGQTMYLESLLAPGQVVPAIVSQIKPEVGLMNRSLMVVADLENPGFWRPEATVEARVVVERRAGAITVPQLSVVSRPAGDVVYRLEDGLARQQRVATGETHGDWVEIRTGLQAGDRVVRDGAQYLSEGAPVTVQGSQQ